MQITTDRDILKIVFVGPVQPSSGLFECGVYYLVDQMGLCLTRQYYEDRYAETVASEVYVDIMSSIRSLRSLIVL